MPEDVNVSKGTIAAVSMALALIGAGATGGVRLHSLQTAVAQTASAQTAQEVRLQKVEQVATNLDALTKLKCLEARDLADAKQREQAFDRLALSKIDCRPVVPTAPAPAP
jgi:hypothetical protein